MIKVADVLSYLNVNLCESDEFVSTDMGDDGFIVFDHKSEGERIIVSLDFSDEASFPVCITVCGDGAPDYMEFSIGEDGSIRKQMTWAPDAKVDARACNAIMTLVKMIKGAVYFAGYNAAEAEREAMIASALGR